MRRTLPSHPSRPFLGALLALGLLLQACTLPTRHAYQKDTAMPEPTTLSPRLQQLFAKTKRVCVGRYALEVPLEAEVRWGPSAFPGDIEVIHGGIEAADKRVARDIAKIKEKNRTAEITMNRPGPVQNSWQLRFYSSKSFKEAGLLEVRTYVNIGDVTFITQGGVSKSRGDTEISAATQQANFAKNLRLRAADEIPDEPGFCIQEGFIRDNRYDDQETTSAGIFLPSFPDINFSLSSNKDAYADYSNWAAYKPKLSLLARIAGAQQAQGRFYPSRTLLREGKRDVQHWHGEESLIRRKDGTHDFEWAFVGTPRDVANPSEYSTHLYSKVAHDTVGAAAQASLTDDEAVALWDKLLSGLKFRVQVPGAPEGSYYASPATPTRSNP